MKTEAFIRQNRFSESFSRAVSYFPGFYEKITLNFDVVGGSPFYCFISAAEWNELRTHFKGRAIGFCINFFYAFHLWKIYWNFIRFCRKSSKGCLSSSSFFRSHFFQFLPAVNLLISKNRKVYYGDSYLRVISNAGENSKILSYFPFISNWKATQIK